MKNLRTGVVLLGLVVYLAAYYATPLPVEGQPLRRIDVLQQIALLPDMLLFSPWFGSPPQFTVCDRVPVLSVAVAILVWAAVLGWLLLCGTGILAGPRKQGGIASEGSEKRPSLGHRASVTQLTGLETFVFSTAVGLATLSTWVLLGLFGLLGRTWTFSVPAAVTLLVAVCLWRRRGREDSMRPMAAGTAAVAATERVSNEILSVRWLWLAMPFVLAILLAAMLPPFDFDVREYHLQAPKEFYEQGRITFLPHNVYANMAMGTEMLSLLAMVITGDWWYGALVGKTVLAAFTPVCALALFCAGRRFYSTSAGVAAALLYISTAWFASTSILPSDVNVSSSGLVEGALACYLFLAVYAVLLCNGTQSGRASEGAEAGPSLALRASEIAAVRSRHPAGLLLLAGYLAGAAVAAKYPAALMVLMPLAVWVFVSNSRESKGLGARRVAVFLLAAFVACGLWFGKNWALTGNPTYPLLYSAFDGKTWNAEKEARWNRVHRPHDFSAAALGKDLGRVALTSPWLSPLVVPLAALAFFRRRGRSTFVWPLLAYFIFVIAVWWLFTHRIDRFWIPVLPVATLLAGAGACWTAERWWRWCLRGLLLVVLAANFLVAAAGPGNAWFVPLATLRTDEKWVPDGWHRYFNAHAGEGAVLTVGDAEVFDLQPRVFYSTCFDDCVFEQLVKDKSPGEVRAELAARHIAFVYVHWSEIARYRRRGNYGFTDFVQPAVFARLVEEGVLAPLPASGDRPPDRAYRVVSENRWGRGGTSRREADAR